MNYSDQIEFRTEAEVDGEKGWYWIKSDHGAWDGPAKEFKPLVTEVLKHIKKDNTTVCIQAGGCLGMYPRLLYKYFNKVYTFEPDPLSFHVLCLNTPFDDIIKFNCALGNGESVKINRMSMNNVGMHTCEDGGFIPALRIDDIPFPNVSYIQLDVEGRESSVIEGAIETIKKFRPVISVEHFREPQSTMLINLGYESIGQHGYDTVLIPK